MSETSSQVATRLLPRWTQPPRDLEARVPGSKSLTNRALILAAVARGRSVLTGALDSDDTRVMRRALDRLGVSVRAADGGSTLTVDGCSGRFPRETAELECGNSGTSLRFLAAMLAAAGRGPYRLDGNPRMRQRPAADLIQALNGLGAFASSELGTGYPPLLIRVEEPGLDGGFAFVKGDVSSQFLSALLMALPLAKGPSSIEVEGDLVSKPYVTMTMKMMEHFGVIISNRDFKRFNIRPSAYTAAHCAIEPDASAASYFWALAAISGGSVRVVGLDDASVQGDVAFVQVLEHMGCRVDRNARGIQVAGGPLRGVDVDMNAISDTVMTLAVVALFAEGPTRIRRVGHIRHKETDRIAALATELRKFGAEAIAHPDGLTILPPSDPAQLVPARVSTYDDHRMAMAFALTSARLEGVIIEDPGCVAKTYPGFWEDFEALRLQAQASRE
ncbi:3-phosphoshikimate 1-carboxyvinyltransferase [Isosphaera pallida ATCC 43644]|uniref:3-phosphoshikimate 1-carboxyvinyltransferase n=1 Tax=Isosphaera pallida (strain ATCC 43644 / DSM 9630 / IS1B) TaxID=575540 RepID=E8R631_ISOPI|nr:3-phosphoshikimate 1-carboxyvinyltransferase [Isosphaera pallida]ADV60726.1 3-phosphoshikimate 1-carboxyvinyltransferase [Isosphaera pallida ATCC 43644]